MVALSWLDNMLQRRETFMSQITLLGASPGCDWLLRDVQD
jgi:hypothetical protein